MFKKSNITIGFVPKDLPKDYFRDIVFTDYEFSWLAETADDPGD